MLNSIFTQLWHVSNIQFYGLFIIHNVMGYWSSGTIFSHLCRIHYLTPICTLDRIVHMLILSLSVVNVGTFGGYE